MTRFILLAAALLAINPVTDWFVDFQFKKEHESVGYGPADRDALAQLQHRELDRKPAKAKQHMSLAEQAAALNDLFGRKGFD